MTTGAFMLLSGFIHDRRALAIASEVVRATRFHGLAHFEMRIDQRDGTLYAIECNPRVWGSLLY
jgi:predicted ATP-grasp superfamily ATP-dependent carboligase